MPEITASHNQIEYTVSEIAGAVKRVVEDTFGHIRVRGEITEWKIASSGHVYFTLKDEKAVLSSVCWRGTAQRLPFKPEDGLEVICTGKVSTYPGSSRYQLIVDRMEPAGVGALMALLEKRKQELAREGLFDPARKKPLPAMPSVIGVVTSPTGAVIRDILHRLRERFPVHVVVWPVLVQGEGAATQISAAINGFNALAADGGVPRPDLIIVARGGGSLEDLWAFNEENVVRAAAASRIPLISAVGHETDTTLIDFASDLRAPTPTAAAEIAVPVRTELLLALSDMTGRMNLSLVRGLERKEEMVKGLARGLLHPAQLLAGMVQKLDDVTGRLQRALPLLFAQKKEKLALLAASLRPASLLRDTLQQQALLAQVGERMAVAAKRMVMEREQSLRGMSSLLESLNYKKVLARGFVMVKSGQELITSAASMTKGSTAQLVFHDGEVTVTAGDAPTKKTASASASSKQSSLF